jgi:hypothetical protein
MMKITIELDSAISEDRDRTLGVVTITNMGERTALTRGKEADYNITFYNRAGVAFRHKQIKRWKRKNKSVWMLMEEVFKREGY